MLFRSDFYCLDEYCLGNINDSSLEQLAAHPVAVRFVEESRNYPDKCKRCRWFCMCMGGCKRERIDLDKCAAYDKFFAYAVPHMRRMS